MWPYPKLTMSVEIRNRIFKLAIDDVLCEPKSTADATVSGSGTTTDDELLESSTYIIDLTNDATTAPPRISDDKPVYLTRQSASRPHVQNWSRIRRCYLGLTQTCRQLREEFLPLHQARVPVGIFLDSLSDYIETLVRSGKVANINVAFAHSCVYHEYPSSSNVKKLFLLCAEESAITIRFEPKVCHEFQEILRNQSKYPRFFEYVRTRVDSTQFVQESFDHHWYEYVRTGVPRATKVRLYLTVKQQFGQLWMRRPYLPGYKQELELWRHELEVDGINVYPRLAVDMAPPF